VGTKLDRDLYCVDRKLLRSNAEFRNIWSVAYSPIYAHFVTEYECGMKEFWIKVEE
jgi:hypothetical protein